MAIVDTLTRSSGITDDGLGANIPEDGIYPDRKYITSSEAAISGFKYGFIQMPDDESDGSGGQNRMGIWPSLANFSIGPPQYYGNSGYGYIGQTARKDYNFADGSVSFKISLKHAGGDPDQKVRLWARIINPHTNTLTAYMAEIAGISGDAANWTFKVYRVDDHDSLAQIGSTYTGALAINDVLKLTCIADSIVLRQNGTSRVTTTDATYTSAGLWGLGAGKLAPFQSGFGLNDLDLEIVYSDVGFLNPITQFGAWEADFYSRSHLEALEEHTTYDAATIGSVSAFSGIDHICHTPVELSFSYKKRFEFYDDIREKQFETLDAYQRFSFFLEETPSSVDC